MKIAIIVIAVLAAIALAVAARYWPIIICPSLTAKHKRIPWATEKH